MAGKKGRSGRPRKPTKLKIIQGTDQPCRMNPDEPMPEEGRPKVRGEMSQNTKAEYERLIEDIEKLGVLTEVDGLAIEICAQNLATYWDCIDILEKEGRTYTVQNKETGYKSVNKRPEIAIADAAQKNATSLLVQFGLTAASRPRVSTNPKKPKESKWGDIGK